MGQRRTNRIKNIISASEQLEDEDDIVCTSPKVSEILRNCKRRYMENKELIDPTEIHLDLRREYSKNLYPKFKDLILDFLSLGVNESIFGANMSIKCIQKDEGYSLFYWNHFLQVSTMRQTDYDSGNSSFPK